MYQNAEQIRRIIMPDPTPINQQSPAPANNQPPAATPATDSASAPESLQPVRQTEHSDGSGSPRVYDPNDPNDIAPPPAPSSTGTQSSGGSQTGSTPRSYDPNDPNDIAPPSTPPPGSAGTSTSSQSSPTTSTSSQPSPTTSTSSTSSGTGSTQPTTTPATREATLRKKYVTDYKAKKEKEDNELNGNNTGSNAGGNANGGSGANPPAGANNVTANGTGSAPPTSGGKSIGDHIEEFADSDIAEWGSNISGDLFGSFSSANDVAQAYKKEGVSEDNADRMDKAAKGLNVIGSVADTTFNGLSLYSNARKTRRANQGHNKQEKSRARWATAASTFNMAGSLTNLGGSIAGAAGASDLAGDIVGTVGSGFGLVGSSLDLHNSVLDKRQNRRISAETGKLLAIDEEVNKASAEVKKARGDGKTPLNATQKEKLIAAKKARNNVKAANAMKYAKSNALRKANAAKGDIVKNSLGTAANALGFASSMSGIFLGTSGLAKAKAWTGFGANIGSMALKYLGMGIGKKMSSNAERTKNTEKKRDINEYIDKKVRDIVSEGAQDNVTEKEAKKIVLARLGVEFDGSKPETKLEGDTDLSDNQLMDGFNKLMLKRAKNIMESDKKNEMLTAMQLEPGATLEEIAEQLGAEF